MKRVLVGFVLVASLLLILPWSSSAQDGVCNGMTAGQLSSNFVTG
jgi:hypothetical protein